MDLNFRFFIEGSNGELSDVEIAHAYMDSRNSVRSISAQTGKSVPEIYRILKKLGVSPNRRKRDQTEAVIGLHRYGFSKSQIKSFTGHSLKKINRILG